MNKLVGKTIAEVEYIDQYEAGISLIFTDGTCLTVSELMQAGAITVYYDGEEIKPEDEDDFNDEALLAEYEEGVHAAELENFDPITHIEAQERTGELK